MVMHKVSRGIALSLLVVTLACHTKITTVPGQLNTFDAYAFRVLMDAQAAIQDFKFSIEKAQLPDTPQTKNALNQAINDYNLAEAAYQAWHASGGTGSTSTVNGPLNILQNDIATLPMGAK